MAGFVDCIAELFEPFTELGRVGFECRPTTDELWEISMYLGRNEVVGGSHDGEAQCVDFQFDIRGLMNLFEEITAFHWNTFPVPSAEKSADRSCLVLEGRYSETGIRLKIFSVPPEESAPGLRMHPDGSWEPV